MKYQRHKLKKRNITKGSIQKIGDVFNAIDIKIGKMGVSKSIALIRLKLLKKQQDSFRMFFTIFKHSTFLYFSMF